MYRCAIDMYRRAVPLLVALVLGTLAPAAGAQVQRFFPADALRGEIVISQPPVLTLNGKPAQLAPGSRIRNRNNMIEMSGALIGQKLPVHYTVDSYGLVNDVWILREDELARKPWPTTPEQAQRWEFDPAAQAWTKR
jgi:hypothetical protein